MSEGIIVAIVGLLSVVLGQTLNQLLQKLLGRAKEKHDEGEKWREELRTEIRRKEDELVRLKTENAMLDNEKDKWRFDYFVLYQAFHEMKVLAVGLIHRLGADNIELPELPRRHSDDEN